MKKVGAILSPIDERDYPICMAYEDKPMDIPESFTTSFQPPYAKQISGNCVAQTIANIMEVMYYNMMGKHEDFSVGFVYGNRTQYEHDGEGMTGRMACNHLVEDGNVKSAVFDNDCEAPGIIRAVNKFKEQFPNWKEFTYVPVRYVRTKKADEVKKFIMRYNVPVLAIVDTEHFYWSVGLHAMALYGWDGDTAIMQNSWGEKNNPIVKVAFKDIEEFWLIVPFEIANFTDLSSEHWAYDSIIKCVDEKLLMGYPDNTFAPDQGLTRAEMAVLIYRMMKENEHE
jgi:hypothetical protein